MEQVITFNDLGDQVDEKLSFTPHVEHLVGKSKLRIGLYYGHNFVFPKIDDSLYFSICFAL